MTENNLDRTQIAAAPGVQRTQVVAGLTCPVCGITTPPGEEYCADCGFLLTSEVAVGAEAAVPEVMVRLVEPSTGREFILRPGVNTIGRQDADVLLLHPTVSRKHAQLTVDDGTYILEDLGNTNGTFVGTEKVEPGQPVEIERGTEITFGSAVLRLEAPEPDVALSAAEAAVEIEEAEEREEKAEESAALDAAAEEAPPPPVEEEEEEHEAADRAEAAEIPIEPGVEVSFEATPEQALAEPIEPVEIHEEMPTLARLVAKAGEEEFAVRQGENTLGRRPANDIVIPDAYVSGSHAVMAAEDGRFTITDIGSTNGTFVNDDRLAPNEPRELFDGDTIMVGQSVFRFTI